MDRWDVKRTESRMIHEFCTAALGGVPLRVAYRQQFRFAKVDLDREGGWFARPCGLSADGCAQEKGEHGVEGYKLPYHERSQRTAR